MSYTFLVISNHSIDYYIFFRKGYLNLVVATKYIFGFAAVIKILVLITKTISRGKQISDLDIKMRYKYVSSITQSKQKELLKRLLHNSKK